MYYPRCVPLIRKPELQNFLVSVTGVTFGWWQVHSYHNAFRSFKLILIQLNVVNLFGIVVMPLFSDVFFISFSRSLVWSLLCGHWIWLFNWRYMASFMLRSSKHVMEINQYLGFLVLIIFKNALHKSISNLLVDKKCSLLWPTVRNILI